MVLMQVFLIYQLLQSLVTLPNRLEKRFNLTSSCWSCVTTNGKLIRCPERKRAEPRQAPSALPLRNDRNIRSLLLPKATIKDDHGLQRCYVTYSGYFLKYVCLAPRY
jgi:hypothetical protein